MGTDIHTVVAKKKSTGSLEVIGFNVAGEPRDYNSFVVLAGLRNGFGFAGFATGDAWDVLFPPKGLPEGFSEEVEVEPFVDHFGNVQRYWSLGEHTHSYLSLEELNKIREHYRERKHRGVGVLAKEDYLYLQKTGERPRTFSLGVFGSSFYQEDDGVFDAASEDERKRITHVRTSWIEPALDRLYFLKCAISELEKAAYKHGISDSEVVLVFGFDS